MKKDSTRYPKGWNRARIERVIAYHDKQTESDSIAEAQAAWENARIALVRVPSELTTQIQKLIDQHKRSSDHRSSRRRRTA